MKDETARAYGKLSSMLWKRLEQGEKDYESDWYKNKHNLFEMLREEIADISGFAVLLWRRLDELEPSYEKAIHHKEREDYSYKGKRKETLCQENGKTSPKRSRLVKDVACLREELRLFRQHYHPSMLADEVFSLSEKLQELTRIVSESLSLEPQDTVSTEPWSCQDSTDRT